MKKIVGIDFGTTNVRICEWDAETDERASSSEIGVGGTATVMPAVIAFTRLPGGEVSVEVGEDADNRDDDPDTSIVIRNIKRWATGSDQYVAKQLEWSLEQNSEPWPTWWDRHSRSVRLWDMTMPVEDVVRRILKEAISRAGLEGEAAEWRAGCPVNSDLVFRKTILSALTDLGCAGRVTWITEEPLLLLTLGMEINSLQDGSYLVYDLGGGSFDCAIAEIDNGRMIVLSEEGIPTLGGMNIDDALTKKLNYTGPSNQLRVAKEQLSSSADVRVQNLTLTQEHINEILEEEGFIEKTLTSMLDAYKKAKLLWKRERHAGAPPIGENLEEGRTTDSYKSVWSLNYEDLREDVDKILLVGGPTQFPYFRDRLGKMFGHDKIMTTEDIVSRSDIPVPALTAISHGACYTYNPENQYALPLTLDRIPASITLSVTDVDSIHEDTYEAFHKLPFNKPMANHVGQWVTIRSDGDKTYSVLVETSDGETEYSFGPVDLRMPRETYRGPRADSARLVVDRLGSVWVEIYPISIKDDLQKVSDQHDARHNFRPTPNPHVLIFRNPFWQTDEQRNKIEELLEKQRKYEKEKAAILHRNITQNPFGHHERPG